MASIIRYLCFVILQASLALQACEISHYFGDDEEGAFLLYDVSQKAPLIEYNPLVCSTKLSPGATFKIPSALIGLDLGILENENTLYEWDGQLQEFAAWERDHTLQSALHYSIVWYFQRLAEKVGEEHFRDYLAKFDYGNGDVSTGLNDFWLGHSLQITPEQQLQFLLKLYTDELPVSNHALETVRKILILEQGPEWILSGKTGMDEIQLAGWFVGNICVGKKSYVFVTCMRGKQATGARAKAVTQEILQDLFIKENGAWN